MKAAERIELSCGPKQDEFVLTIGNDKIRFSLAILRRDADSDGLSDIAELRLGTNPYDADTDDDGKEDGKDSNPLSGPGAANTEEGRIRQAVFTFFAGTSDSTSPIYVYNNGDGGSQEYYGYSGFVVHTARESAGRYMTISISSRTSESATVRLIGVIGGIRTLGTLGHFLVLRKLGGSDGNWFVDSIEDTSAARGIP